MKLKTALFDGSKHNDVTAALAWYSNDEVYSCGDDHVLMKFNFLTNDSVVITKLPEDFYPISLHWCPKTSNLSKKSGPDLLLAASADGKFHFLNKNGRFDRSVDAHQGAVLVALWSFDGAGILTAGEDGQVKVWSRGGMLRSTVVSGDVPVYTAAWGPDSNQVLIAQGRTLLLKPLAPNSKPNRWRGHEGLILKVAWNQNNNLIVSAGEDCRYKVWNALGHLLHTSSVHDHPVTSVSWAPGGDLFAVASFNTIRLCDRIGWSHSLEKVATGSIYDLAWSLDGTQLAGACGNGSLIFAHVIDRKMEWKNLEIVLLTKETILVRNVTEDSEEKLEFSDRIAKMALGFDHFVVNTASQCYIYTTNNFNTPNIIHLKEGCVSHIYLTYKCFFLIEKNSLNIYGYDGKLLCSPKIGALQMDLVDESSIALSPDTLVVIDQTDNKTIHVMDLAHRQATPLTPIHHSQSVLQVCLSHTGNQADRLLAFLDINRDAYIYLVRARDGHRPGKLGTMVSNLRWASDAAILAGIRDSILTIWCCPLALHVDTHLLRQTTFSRDLSDIGKGVVLVSFVGNLISLRRSDGCLVSQPVPPYIAASLKLIAEDKWDDVLRLCRFVNVDLLWACLAFMAGVKKELTTCEEAFTAINEFDKVSFLRFVKALPLQPARNAYMAVLSGQLAEAESILLAHGMVFRLILLFIDTHHWLRALDLAVKHRTHIDTVLYKRRLYLDSFGKVETIEKFTQYQQNVDLDVSAIESKITAALAKEKEDI